MKKEDSVSETGPAWQTKQQTKSASIMDAFKTGAAILLLLGIILLNMCIFGWVSIAANNAIIGMFAVIIVAIPELGLIIFICGR